jgi:uncharacterized protein (DUF697 family)
MEPYSTLNFSGSSYSTTEASTIWFDNDFRQAAKIEELIDFLWDSVSLNANRVQRQVRDWNTGSRRNNNDARAKHVIERKAMKAEFFGAVFALGPAYLMPLDFAKDLAQLTMQAEMAYAIACVYGSPPRAADFKNDLYVLIIGEAELRKDTDLLKELGVKSVDEIRKSWATKELANRRFADNYRRVTALKVSEMLMPEGIDKAIAVIGSVIGGNTSGTRARTFGAWAHKYYAK